MTERLHLCEEIRTRKPTTLTAKGSNARTESDTATTNATPIIPVYAANGGEEMEFTMGNEPNLSENLRRLGR
jgi:hypothetical protein